MGTLREFLIMSPKLLLTAAMTCALGACSTVSSVARVEVATATLSNANSMPTGVATLVAVGDRVDLHVEVRGIAAGTHGIHLHAIGQCAPADFVSAGSHLNPAGKAHGSENPAGSHLGDLPNMTVRESGAGSLDVLLPGIRSEILPQILDSDGTAIVVHANADDYRTDPSGASGARIACGVFNQVR